MQGTVKWFNATKGFGFIDSKGKDYFCHFSQILSDGYKQLEAGDEVEFTPTVNSKGVCAESVKKIG